MTPDQRSVIYEGADRLGEYFGQDKIERAKTVHPPKRPHRQDLWPPEVWAEMQRIYAGENEATGCAPNRASASLPAGKGPEAPANNIRAHRSATDRAFVASQSSRERLDPSGFNPIAQEQKS